MNYQRQRTILADKFETGNKNLAENKELVDMFYGDLSKRKSSNWQVFSVCFGFIVEVYLCLSLNIKK